VDRVLFSPRDLPPIGPDVAGDLPRYRAWQHEREAERLTGRIREAGNARATGKGALEIALLLVIDSPEAGLLRRCLRSVTGQTTGSWRLSISLIGPTSQEAEAVVDEELGNLAAGVALVGTCPPGTGEAEAAAAALSRCSSPAFALLGQHDQLAPDALALLAAALGCTGSDTPGSTTRGSTSGSTSTICSTTDGISGSRSATADTTPGTTADRAATAYADVAYGDDDAVGADGLLSDPRLKPDWSPDLLLSWSYLGRPTALRRRVAEEAGGIRPVEGGDWEHDLLLRVTERSDRVAHIAEVICHRQAASINSPGALGNGAVVTAMNRRGEVGEVDPGPLPGTWSIRRRPHGRPKVSAIVPFRDGAGFLRACVDSVSETAATDGIDLELVLVDNGSVEPETLTLVEHLAARSDVTVVHDARPFNWAALNNAAADAARGEILLFLNNDIEARRQGWLPLLAAHTMRPDVAAAGARLLYPGGRVQHAGVVVGMGGAAGHVLVGLPGDRPGYLGMAVLTRDCSALTGACLATRRTVFDDLGRFDEGLGLDLNDIDFCLRGREQGLRVVFEPKAELVHHESPSRGTSGSVEDISRFIDRWEGLITAGDPFLSAHLTRISSSCALRETDEDGWWQAWRSSLARS